MSSHVEVFRIVVGGVGAVIEEFDTYEDALAYGTDRFNRFRIEKLYVRKP